MRLFKNFALVFLFIGTLASCDGMDATYKEFIEEGPIVYIGKVDSLKAYAGRNRAMLEWQKLLDPRAKTAKIFWENRTRSTELQLTDKAGLTQVIVKDLAEGSYVFEVCTYDTHGNSSIMSEVPCTVYGDVPLIKTQQTAGDDLQVSRSPKEEVYELIIQDLKDAASMLPAQYELSSDIGRATKGASLGLLAKVYLTLKKYDDVISTIEELDALNIYTLNRKYDWNFDYLRENGPESLFEVQYEKDVTTYSEFDILGQGGWHNDYMAPLAPIAIGGRWGNFGWFAVYPEFVNAYEAGDLRKSVSVWCQGDQYKGWAYDPSVSQTGHNVKKFLCEDIGQDRAMDSPLNFPILRYADVLLMYAEALNEKGRTSEVCAPAASYEEGGPLNRVRVRAGLPEVTTEDQAELREIIRHERRMELAFEGGHRWFDLIRYDENGEYAKKFFHSIGKTNFTTPKHLLLPVPMDDIDANPNLRPNNPGY